MRMTSCSVPGAPDLWHITVNSHNLTSTERFSQGWRRQLSSRWFDNQIVVDIPSRIVSWYSPLAFCCTSLCWEGACGQWLKMQFCQMHLGFSQLLSFVSSLSFFIWCAGQENAGYIVNFWTRERQVKEGRSGGWWRSFFGKKTWDLQWMWFFRWTKTVSFWFFSKSPSFETKRKILEGTFCPMPCQCLEKFLKQFIPPVMKRITFLICIYQVYIRSYKTFRNSIRKIEYL